MADWLRRIARLIILGAAGAIVAVWFRNRLPREVDEPGLASASWPPLRPLPEPTDGSPAEPSPTTLPQSAWLPPDAEGDCPASHPIKAKERSGIYHAPGGLAYERTNADRCYCSGDDAAADGFRASKA
jgi:hypothetical protein